VGSRKRPNSAALSGSQTKAPGFAGGYLPVLTGGGLWPVDRTRAEIGNVIILSAEDDAEDTIVPRLIAAGAVLARCFVLDAVADGFTATGAEVRRSFNLARDLAALEEMVQRIGGAAMIVIDPISAYLGEVDSHRNAEVRALLTPLADLAARHRAAVVGVSHLSKSSGGDARLRVNGSLAFVAAARAAWLVHRDADDPGRRLFLPLKNNIGKDGSGLSYRIESATVGDGIETSRVCWDSEPVSVSAEDALNTEPQRAPKASQSAEQFMLDLLRQAGPDGMPVREIRAEARDAGHAWRTLERIKSEVGIKAVRTGFGKAGGWVWKLPAYTASGSKTQEFGGLCAEQGLEPAPGLAITKDRQSAKCEEEAADFGGEWEGDL
jgi:putative DNA primase/helicase